MSMMKFLKIDILRAKSYLYFLAFPLLAFLILAMESDATPTFGVMYCLFGGIVLSTLPFSLCSQFKTGFLRMLPARTGDDVRAHFLFGLLGLLLNAAFSLAAVAAARVLHPAMRSVPLYLYFLLFSASLIITALQNMVLCMFHSNNAHAMQIVRVAPGFLFFFGFTFLAEHFPALLPALVQWLNTRNALILLAASLILYLIIAQISAILYHRQDD